MNPTPCDINWRCPQQDQSFLHHRGPILFINTRGTIRESQAQYLTRTASPLGGVLDEAHDEIVVGWCWAEKQPHPPAGPFSIFEVEAPEPHETECCCLTIYSEGSPEGHWSKHKFARSLEAIKALHQHLLHNGPDSLDGLNFELRNLYR